MQFHSWVYRKMNSIVSVCNSDSSQFIDWSGYVIWALHRGTPYPLTPQPWGIALVPLGRCDLLEQTFLQCDSLLPPPHPHSAPPHPSSAHALIQTQTQKLRLREPPLLLQLLPFIQTPLPSPRSLSLGTFIKRLRLLRPRQWSAPSTTYLLRPTTRVMGLWLSWPTLSNSWREGGERRMVYVSCYNHTSYLCDLSCLTLQTKDKGREQE